MLDLFVLLGIAVWIVIGNRDPVPRDPETPPDQVWNYAAPPLCKKVNR